MGDRQFFAGEFLTFPDFVMYELLDQHRMLAPDQIKAHKKLDTFVDRFEALPKIRAYMESDRYRKGPINNKMAKKKSNLKIVAVGKPNIGFLPLSIGKKVLRKMAVMQEDEKLTENVSTKVNKEDENQESR